LGQLIYVFDFGCGQRDERLSRESIGLVDSAILQHLLGIIWPDSSLHHEAACFGAGLLNQG